MASSSEKHDVFINFRGEDTRIVFTGHLHSALEQQKIITFIDYDLNKGDEVWPKLDQAIKDSLMSILVFSENYAFSKWCLKELVEIMECRKNKGQVVIPVFYNTDPSHVRKQTESYKKAFEKLEEDLRKELQHEDAVQKKLSKWRAVLTESANISGWDSRTHRDDAQLIQNIVKDIRQKLYLRYPHELQGVIENKKACGDIESRLKRVPVIGIWGMGGTGKTTIARTMFAKHFPSYESSCFLANVREESIKHGLPDLVGKLLSDLLKEEIHSSDVVGGSSFIKRRVGSLKAFIVLDDVEGYDQLESLCTQLGRLGEHSKLIITARDKETFKGVGEIYELEQWGFEESLRLFSLNAFKKEHPEKGYEVLSKRALDYAGGVPLALKVLGSSLYKGTPEFWGSWLDKLKEYPAEKINSALKVSYDGLDNTEKDIFLDIAFFFKGQNKDYVIRMLNACDFHASVGVDALVNKALITISYSNTIQMHDLLEEMGLYIVCEEYRSDPGRRSRLKDVQDVCNVLKNKGGTGKVQGIALDLSQTDDLHFSAESFNRMINLRFIRFHNPLGRKSGNKGSYPKAIKPFSDKLRYFEWNGYPLKSLPPNFCPKWLVEFRMPRGNVKELWEGTQDLVNLEGIDLQECKQLTKLPDLSRASKLKWVNLSGCENLCVVHLSIEGLVTLILDGCKKLKSLKSEKHLPSLKEISVDGCSSLTEFSLTSDLVERLDLSTTKIQILHPSIGRLPKLVWFNLEGLRLKTLPHELSCLKSLEELRISNCIGVIDKQKLHALCDGLQSLRKLHLKDCNKLSEFSDNIEVLSKLNELRLDGSSVVRLPSSIKHLQELEILSLENCRKLQFIPELPPFIEDFCADNCTSLVTVSTLMSFATNMKGKGKFISFKNCKKVEGSSLQCIMEGALLTIMSAAFHNVSVRMYESYAYRNDYNTIEVCLAGSRVPRQFTYRNRTTESSSVTIQLPPRSNWLDFICCVVLSPSRGMKKNGTAKIQCQCYLADGTKVGDTSTRHCNATIIDSNSDHVYAWYDPFHCDSILGAHEQEICFKFSATTDNGDECDGMISIKECGVRLICVSDLDNCLRQQELKKDLNLALKVGLAMDLMQRYVELESRLLFALENGLELGISLKLEFESRRRAMLALLEEESNGTGTEIRNQEGDTSEKCSRSGDRLVGVKILGFTILAYIVLNQVIKKRS